MSYINADLPPYLAGKKAENTQKGAPAPFVPPVPDILTRERRAWTDEELAALDAEVDARTNGNGGDDGNQ